MEFGGETIETIVLNFVKFFYVDYFSVSAFIFLKFVVRTLSFPPPPGEYKT
jgi:hypothetical protein